MSCFTFTRWNWDGKGRMGYIERSKNFALQKERSVCLVVAWLAVLSAKEIVVTHQGKGETDRS